jgi:hypothetical protein
MDAANLNFGQLLNTLLSAIVWIVGIMVLGRLGMFIAKKWFEFRKMEMNADREDAAGHIEPKRK